MSDFPGVTIPDTEVRMLHSDHVAEDFRIMIAFPSDYEQSDNDYPVVYVLDANQFFGTVTEAARTMRISRDVPPVLIVGIAYPTDLMRNIRVLRLRDATPTTDASMVARLEQAWQQPVPTGGAETFASFIHTELMPFINANYRTQPDNTVLIGISVMGLFVLYHLFHYPDSIQRYVAGSPSLGWNNGIIFEFESDYAANHEDLPAVLFLSSGMLEETVPQHSVSNLLRFSATLQNRKYPGLKLDQFLFEGETHFSVVSATIARGLRTVFCDKDSDTG